MIPLIFASAHSHKLQHAAADLERYLTQVTGIFVSLAEPRNQVSADVRFLLGFVGDAAFGDQLLAEGRVGPPPGPEGYCLKRLEDDAGVIIAVIGADEPGAVYGTYALLEEAYGCGFFLGSEVVPSGTIPLVPSTLMLKRAPAFAMRGLLPWYDFLSGPSAWNLADYKLYIDRMIRMGLNFLGLHIYSKGLVTQSQGAEPFLSFTYHGVGHASMLDTTQTSRWGYLPMRTSDFAYGTNWYFSDEVFGSDAAIAATDSLDAVKRAKSLLQQALTDEDQHTPCLCPHPSRRDHP